SLAKASSPTKTGRNRRNGSPKPRRGYHRAVTPPVAAEICRRIASGRTLLSVCGDSDMTHHDAIYDEMRRSPSFAEAIARARAESAHGLAMQVLEIADERVRRSEEHTSELQSRGHLVCRLLLE